MKGTSPSRAIRSIAQTGNEVPRWEVRNLINSLGSGVHGYCDSWNRPRLPTTEPPAVFCMHLICMTSTGKQYEAQKNKEKPNWPEPLKQIVLERRDEDSGAVTTMGNRILCCGDSGVRIRAEIEEQHEP
jgi:hypothetical protein